MDSESMDREWRALSEEILLGMKEWRQQHPKATLREIEEAVTERLSRLGARMIQDAAQTSAAADWTKQVEAEAPRCEHCGEVLVSRGKRPRRLQASGGAQVTIERSYGTCPRCGVGLFPPG
jgi:ribosomal protein S27AE